MPTGSKPSPGPLTQEVAAILRGQQARLRVPVADLAAAVHVSESQVRKMLTGTKHIDIDQLDALAFALDLNFRDVARDADEGSEIRFAPERQLD